VPYDNKIELQFARPTDAQRSSEARHKKSGGREPALAFTAQRSSHPRSNTPQRHTPRLKFLAANDNPTRTVTLLVLRNEGSDQRESKGLSLRRLAPSRSTLPRPPRRPIANLELEFLASHTKHSLLSFSNRKKIAVFDPHLSPPIGEPRKLSSPLGCPDDRYSTRSAAHQHVSNRSKNACFILSHSRIASHEIRVTSHDSRTTTRAAFRSTIPARPRAYR
jgi:hypothetical protein